MADDASKQGQDLGKAVGKMSGLMASGPAGGAGLVAKAAMDSIHKLVGAANSKDTTDGSKPQQTFSANAKLYDHPPETGGY